MTIDPLLQQDRIALGVMANRTLELPGVSGVTMFTIDNQVLATSGRSEEGLRYTEPVTRHDSIMGYVRVTLTRDTGQPSIAPMLLGLVAMLLAPLMAVGMFSVRYTPAPKARASEDTRGASDPSTDAPPTGAQPAVTEDHHLVAVNLYNQISMTREARKAELDHAQAIAQKVVDLYVGDVRALAGTGLLVHFPPGNDADRALQVLCATFVLAKLLAQHEDADVGTYRLGLHTVALPVGVELNAHAREIADVALLSALAKHMTVAVSGTFPIETLREDQVTSSPLQHPLLDELATVAGARLVADLSPVQQKLVTQQVGHLSDDLSGQWGSTASESTF
jgi:hypothetical protein